MRDRKKRILLVKLASMGDVIVSSQHATQIKEKFPSYEIDFMTMTHMGEIVERIPNVNSIIKIPNTFSFLSLMKILRIFFLMLLKRYDIAFNFHRNWKINFFLKIARVKRIYGFHGKMNSILLTDTTDFNIFQNRTLQENRLINLSGFDLVSPNKLSIKSSKGISKVFQSKKYYCLSLGGGNLFSDAKNRMWPLENYIKLHDKVNDYCVLVGKGSHDEELANSFQNKARNQSITNLVGRLSLTETISVIERCNFFIGNDSGLSYVAAALNKKTIVLFGPTPSSAALPLGENVKAVVGHSFCSPCYNPFDGINGLMYTCKSNECLKSLTVDKVSQNITDFVR